MVAVILGLCLLIVLVSKKVNVIVAAPVVIMLVALGNGLSPIAVVTGPYVEGVAGFIQSFVFIFILGSIFGKVMEQSGGAYSIGNALVRILGTKRAATAIFLASFLLGIGGIAGYVIIFTLYPLGLSVFEQANLPRRLLIASIGAGIIMAISAPATPQIQNLMPMDYLGTASTAGFWPGIFTVTLASLLISFYLEKVAARARRQEEGFTPPIGYASRQNAAYPPLYIACIPLVAIVVLLSVFAIDPLVSLGLGVLLAFVVLFTWLPQPLEVLNEGTKTAMMPLLFASSSVGFGVALQAVPSFLAFIEQLVNSSLNPLILAAIITNAAAGVVGSASGGVVLTLSTVAPELATTADPALLHRIITLSAAGLDTLPHNNGYLTMLAFSGLTFAETYKEYFVTTVIAPLAAIFALFVLFSVGVFI